MKDKHIFTVSFAVKMSCFVCPYFTGAIKKSCSCLTCFCFTGITFYSVFIESILTDI